MQRFLEWQPRYAHHGVPIFPVRIDDEDKRPLVRGYLRTNAERSARLVRKFGHAESFGFACGPTSRLTIVDMDSTDEVIVGESARLFGESPLIWRTGGGKFAAAYRYNGEARRIRPLAGLPLDLLGARGFAVAPPSRGAIHSYEIIRGTLRDLDRLPAARMPNEILRQPARAGKPIGSRIPKGRRNEILFNFARAQARYVDDEATLLDVVLTRNSEGCDEPLPVEEVRRLVASAWRYQTEGRNFPERGQMLITSFSDIDQLAAQDPDAFALWSILRRYHWGHPGFVLSNAMARKLSWTLRRFRSARDKLVEMKILVCLHAGGRGQHDPPRYAFSLTNSNRHSALASDAYLSGLAHVLPDAGARST